VMPLSDPFSSPFQGPFAVPEPDSSLLPLDEDEEKGLDIGDYIFDIGRGVVRGGLGFGQSVYNLADAITGDDLLKDRDFRSSIDAPKTIAGNLASGFTQVGIGLFTGGALLKGVTGLSAVVRGGAVGAIADFLAFDPHEARLSNLLKDHLGVKNVVTDFLVADDRDGELEGRLKNVLEGGIAGGVVGAAFSGGRVLFLSAKRLKARKARAALISEEVQRLRKANPTATEEELVEKALTTLPDPSIKPPDPSVKDELPVTAEPVWNKVQAGEYTQTASSRSITIRRETEKGPWSVTQSAEKGAIALPLEKSYKTLRQAKDAVKKAGLKDAPKLTDKPSAPKLTDKPSAPKLTDKPSAPKLTDEPASLKDRLASDIDSAGAAEVPDSELITAARSVLDGDEPGSFQVLIDSATRTLQRPGLIDELGLDPQTLAQLTEGSEEEAVHILSNLYQRIETLETIKTVPGKQPPTGRREGINLTRVEGPIEMLAFLKATSQILLGRKGNVLPGSVPAPIPVDEIAFRLMRTDAEKSAEIMGTTADELMEMAQVVSDSLPEQALIIRMHRSLLTQQAMVAKRQIGEALEQTAKAAQLMGSDAGSSVTASANLSASLAVSRGIASFQQLTHSYTILRGATRGTGLNLKALDSVVSFSKGETPPELANSLANHLEMLVRDSFGADKAQTIEMLEKTLVLLSDDKNLAQFGVFVNSLTGAPPTVLQMVQDVFINSLLSSPRSLTTNFISPLATGVLRSVQEGVGGALSGQKGAITDAITEITELVTSLHSFFGSSKEALRTGRSQVMPKSAKFNEFKAQDKPAQRQLERNREIENQRVPTTFAPELHPDSPVWARSIFEFLDSIVSLPTRGIVSTDELITGSNVRVHLKKSLRLELRASGVPDNLIEKGVADSIDKFFVDELLLTTQVFEKRLLDEVLEKRNAGLLTPQGAKELYLIRLKEASASGRLAMADAAAARADEITFKSTLPFGSVGHTSVKVVGAHPLLRFVAPFIKTPINILTFAAKEAYSPITFLASIALKDAETPGLVAFRKKYLMEYYSADPRIRNVARGRFAVASSSMIAFGAAAYKGKITGRGPIDPNQRRTLMQAGWRPYSIRMGNAYVSYERMDPLASVMGGVADMVHYGAYADNGETEGLQKAFGGFIVANLNNLTQKSYLTGLRNAFAALYAPETSGLGLLQDLAASFPPSPQFVSSIADTVDPFSRQARSLLDKVARRIPGISSNIEPYRNIFGEPIERTKRLGTDTIGSIMNLWMPIAISEVSDSIVNKEMANLKHGFTPPKTLVEGVDLLAFRTRSSQSAFDRWQELTGSVRISGKTIKDSMRSLIMTPGYQRLNPRSGEDGGDSDRIKLLRQQLGAFRTRAFQTLMRELPDLKTEVLKQRRSRQTLSYGGSFDFLPFDL